MMEIRVIWVFHCSSCGELKKAETDFNEKIPLLRDENGNLYDYAYCKCRGKDVKHIFLMRLLKDSKIWEG